MSIQYPVADMMTRIRNAQMANKEKVEMPFSNLKQAIAKVLYQEGYIKQVTVQGEGYKAQLVIYLKYHQGRGVIEELRCVSKPALRIYRGKKGLTKVKDGLGIAIVSTTKGVMTDKEARTQGIGGEILGEVF